MVTASDKRLAMESSVFVNQISAVDGYLADTDYQVKAFM